jgi:L-ascorbate metabolism protein UlaG (beta-lactamase superfamily)
MVDVRWTGAAGLEFTHNGQTILIDPYLSRPGKLKVFFRHLSPDISAIERYLEKLPGNLSAIIIGHTHFDHALDIPEFSRHFEGPLVGSQSLEILMAMHNMPGRVTVSEGNRRIELTDELAVTMIPSVHGLVLFGRIPYPGEIDPSAQLPLKASQYRHGAVCVPKLEVGGKTFMHNGSANFIESELQGHQCDVLFMCVPGWKNRPGYPDRMLEITKPKIVVPFHFDDFTAPIHTQLKRRTVPFVDMKGLLHRINQIAPGTEIRVPQPFESMTF